MKIMVHLTADYLWNYWEVGFWLQDTSAPSRDDNLEFEKIPVVAEGPAETKTDRWKGSTVEGTTDPI